MTQRRERSAIVRLGAAGVLAALGARTLYLFVLSSIGRGHVQRFHVESAALLFVVWGLGFKIAYSRGGRADAADRHRPPLWFLPAMMAAAMILYWPALSVGFLSDDYAIVARASTWAVRPVTPALIRPIPILLWAVILHVGGGARALHLSNVLLHGTNAYLTARIVEKRGAGRRWQVVAALLMLTAPLATEAVAWCSGIFDVLATTLLLASVLVASRYERHVPGFTRAQFVALCLAALACKETAVVGVGLVFVDAWARGAVTRPLVTDTAIVAIIVAVFSVVRLTSVFGIVRPPFDKYLVQRAVFGSFGALAVPWHVTVTDRMPWMAVMAGVAVFVLVLLFFFTSSSRQSTKLVIAAAIWVLIPVIPIFPIFFIAPNLEQSRYLYLSATGWAALIVFMSVDVEQSSLKSLALVVPLIIIGMAVDGTMLHLRPWREASRLRDRVEAAAIRDSLSNCETVTLSEMPDSVEGAYVFRNGVAEAFARDLRQKVTVGEPGGPCSFTWNDGTSSFVRASR